MSVELKVLVSEESNPDIGLMNDSIRSMESAKFAVVFSSLTDEISSTNFFQSCIDKLSIPFIGVQTAGCITPSGYVGEGVVLVVFHGDFEFEIHQEGIMFDDLRSNSESISSRLPDSGLCMVFSSSDVKNAMSLNKILEKVHDAKSFVQLWGLVSVSPRVIVTRDGMFCDYLGVVSIRDAKTKYKMYTGFTIDSEKENYLVTRSDDGLIKEIDGMNASERYCSIQRMKPWMLNRVASFVTRHDVNSLMKNMANMNKTLYDGFLKTMVRLLGMKLPNGCVTPIGVTHVSDDGILTAINVPSQTRIFHTLTSEESQLNVFDSIKVDFQDFGPIMISSCILTQYYIDFNFDAVSEKMNGLKSPFVIAFCAGEYGAAEGEKTSNIHHNCSLQVISFK